MAAGRRRCSPSGMCPPKTWKPACVPTCRMVLNKLLTWWALCQPALRVLCWKLVAASRHSCHIMASKLSTNLHQQYIANQLVMHSIAFLLQHVVQCCMPLCHKCMREEKWVHEISRLRMLSAGISGKGGARVTWACQEAGQGSQEGPRCSPAFCCC